MRAPGVTGTGDEQPDPTLRARVLAAAKHLVDEAGGIAVRLESLSMERVIKAAGVSRTSAYREWPTREAFMVDLMCAIVEPQWQRPDTEQGTSEPDAYTLARDAAADHLDRLTTLAGRRWLLGEICRVAIDHHVRTVVDSAHWRAYTALAVSLPALAEPQNRARLHEALVAADTAWLQDTAALIADLGLLLGFRPAPFADHEDIASMLAAVSEGYGLRQAIKPEAVWRDRPVARPEGEESWGIVALICVAALESMVEFDEQHDVAAALPAYLKRLSSHERARSLW